MRMPRVAATAERCEIALECPTTKARSELTDSTPSRRVQAIVGLRLLEMIRDQDLPGEILEAEDPAQTMPRRLGLSDVVVRKIRAYRKDVKKRVRLSDGEVTDLFRLVIRRPDGEEVFYGAGRLLAAMDLRRRWTRVVPRRVQYAVARGRVRRRLKRLFGRRVGGFGRGPFTVEGRALVFIESDPGGEACHFLSGFCQEILEQTGGGVVEVKHTLCQGRGDDQCRWDGQFIDEPDEGAEAGE
jgi:hypothetical protein